MEGNAEGIQKNHLSSRWAVAEAWICLVAVCSLSVSFYFTAERCRSVNFLNKCEAQDRFFRSLAFVSMYFPKLVFCENSIFARRREVAPVILISHRRFN